MSVSKEFVLKALFEKNYFPSQKRAREEMPPILSTETFSVDVAKSIHSLKRRGSRQYSGYDQVEYVATKFNNIPRYFAIPHPKAYVDLCFDIHAFWRLIELQLSRSNGVVKPMEHDDGRLIVMDYEMPYQRHIRHLEMNFGKRFVVKTDVSSCFPSIYTHALPWALVGIERSKKKKPPKWKSKWFNRLDESTRWCKRNETQGVAVGPATSNILAEVLLTAIDRNLQDKYNFERFIDDYSVYTESYEDAEEFVRELSTELKRFNLHLNPNKTSIRSLPQALNEDWLIELNSVLPKGKNPRLVELVGYLDKAVEIQSKHMDASVIKYAAKCIIPKAQDRKRKGVLKYLLLLSPHYPVLIPVIDTLLSTVLEEYSETYENELQHLLNDRTINQCSDGVSWTLFYLLRIDSKIDDVTAEKIIESEDCVSMLMLCLFGKHKQKVIKFCNKLKKADLYRLDQYWLLLYQLYFWGDIENFYNDQCFDVMKESGVTFISSSEQNKANSNVSDFFDFMDFVDETEEF